MLHCILALQAVVLLSGGKRNSSLIGHASYKDCKTLSNCREGIAAQKAEFWRAWIHQVACKGLIVPQQRNELLLSLIPLCIHAADCVMRLEPSVKTSQVKVNLYCTVQQPQLTKALHNDDKMKII